MGFAARYPALADRLEATGWQRRRFRTSAHEAIADADFTDLDPDGPISPGLNQIATGCPWRT